MSRVKTPKKLHDIESFQYTEEDRRFATPQVVAEYRAERLRCEAIADLGCGVGFQTMAFAKTCKKIFAVEKDERKLDYAKKNAVSLGLSNITFIHGDALDPLIVSQLKECQVIFCDTERPPQEAERTLQNIQPNPELIVQTYSTSTPNLAIEVPPHLKDIPFDSEREYLSVNGKLNRLTLYLGKLKQAERSVVLLPEKSRLSGKSQNPIVSLHPPLKMGYLYEVNPATAKAELICEIGDYAFFTYQDKTYATSTELKPSPFLRAYRILGRTPIGLSEIHSALTNAHAGSVTLRQKIDPKDYWKERKRYENGLTGTKKVHLFIFNEALICEEVCDG